jgi:hypothetical protein
MPSDNKNSLKAAADKIMGTSLAAAPSYGGAPSLTPYTGARDPSQAGTDAVVKTGPGGVYDPEALENNPLKQIDEQRNLLSEMTNLMYKQQADKIAADTARYQQRSAQQQAEYSNMANQANAVKSQLSAMSAPAPAAPARPATPPGMTYNTWGVLVNDPNYGVNRGY